MRLLVAVVVAGLCLPAMAADCAGLAKMKGVTWAEVVSGGAFTPEGAKAIDGLPEFCRVTATLDPSGDSAIKVEVWLPLQGWNERLEGTGNGGLAGHISYGALAGGVKAGYAVANTDMGMGVPAGKDAGEFVGHPERWKDWGWRSTHEMTVFAKAVVKAFYGKVEKKDYFVGCSTGGEQALMEAQRFPDDYDGIVGGAPAHNRTGVHESILWNFAAVEAPGAYIPAETLKLLNDAVVKACDMNDGVKDGLIGDPRSCEFDPAVLVCKDDETDGCLTMAQVAAVKKIYDGPSMPRGKPPVPTKVGPGVPEMRPSEFIYQGLTRGSEFGWGGLGPKPPSPDEPALKAPYAPIFQWVFGPEWDWSTFDWGHDTEMFKGRLAGDLNATSTELEVFRSHKHKLLLYHGWADWLVAPEETTHYYNDLMAWGWLREQKTGVAAAAPLDRSVRLFMLPGVAHCGGGPGPSSFDPLAAVVSWVELGKAPDTLTATGNGMTRLLCPYPAEAKYDGKGDVNDPASYACSVRK